MHNYVANQMAEKIENLLKKVTENSISKNDFIKEVDNILDIKEYKMNSRIKEQLGQIMFEDTKNDFDRSYIKKTLKDFNKTNDENFPENKSPLRALKIQKKRELKKSEENLQEI